MISNIQALRALAATMVIFDHLYPCLSALGVDKFGGQAVDLFFVISGFIMVSTTRQVRPTAIDFLKARIARIVPAYWAVTFALFAAAVVVPHMLGATHASLADLVKSLFFIPFLKDGRHVRPILFVGWTLNYEMFFYALFGVALSFKRQSGSLIFVLAVLAALSLYGAVLEPAGVIIGFYTNSIVLDFTFGILVGMIAPLIPATPPPFMRGLAIFGLAAALLSLIFLPYFHVLGGARLVDAGLPSMAIVCLAVALERWRIVIQIPLLMAIGDASYIIYLIHSFITLPFMMMLRPSPSDPLLDVAFIIADLCGCLAVGVIAHTWIERPFLGWLRSARANARADHARSPERLQRLTAR